MTVLTVSGGQAVPGRRPSSCASIAEQRHRRGPMTVGREGKNTGETILRAGKTEGCDLMVKGAFTQAVCGR